MMAEWRYGAARDRRDVIYITVSTGIGGGIVVDGRPLQGRDNTAGEMGHITIDLDGPLCGDGMPGHAEAIGSGTAIAREGRSLLERGEAPVLAALVAVRRVDAALVAAPPTPAIPPAARSSSEPGPPSVHSAPAW